MSEGHDLLKRVQEIQKRVEATTRMMRDDGFAPLEGEPDIFPELKEAVSTLVELRYRGVERWKIYTVHRFTPEGVQVKTYVEDDAGTYPIRFTALEAIAVASAIKAKQQLDK